MRELKLYKSPWKVLRLTLLCSAFVGLGWFELNQTVAPKWIAWSCIGFFGLGIPIGLYQLLDRRPQIIINDVGVLDRNMHHEFINWEIIQDAYLVEMHRQKFLCLIVDQAFEPSRRKGKYKQAVASLNKELGFQELNISLGLISIDAIRFAEFILAMRGAKPAEREAMVQKAIANW